MNTIESREPFTYPLTYEGYVESRDVVKKIIMSIISTNKNLVGIKSDFPNEIFDMITCGIKYCFTQSQIHKFIIGVFNTRYFNIEYLQTTLFDINKKQTSLELIVKLFNENESSRIAEQLFKIRDQYPLLRQICSIKWMDLEDYERDATYLLYITGIWTIQINDCYSKDTAYYQFPFNFDNHDKIEYFNILWIMRFTQTFEEFYEACTVQTLIGLPSGNYLDNEKLWDVSAFWKNIHWTEETITNI